MRGLPLFAGDRCPTQPMDLDYSADERAFREHVRGWLRAHLPAPMRDKVVRYAPLDRDDLLGCRWVLVPWGVPGETAVTAA